MADRKTTEQVVSSILFVAGEAVSLQTLAALLETDADEFEKTIDEIIADEENEGRGILIKKYGNQLRLATNPAYAGYVKRLFAPDITEKLSNAVLETLSVIAYRQPVTRAEIESIRGVRCEYTINTLIDKGMIREVGRKDVIGRPILYGTTDDFLEHFGIRDLSALPELTPDTEQPEELSI